MTVTLHGDVADLIEKQSAIRGYNSPDEFVSNMLKTLSDIEIES